MRLKRFGSKARPYYRVVVMDNRVASCSKVIEEIGQYHPVEKIEANQILLNEDKVKEWLKKGAIPSDSVKSIINKKGISVK